MIMVIPSLIEEQEDLSWLEENESSPGNSTFKGIPWMAWKHI